jgi:hypothetical protein
MPVIAVAEMLGITGRRQELVTLPARGSPRPPSELTVYSADPGVRPINTRPTDPRQAD